MRKIYSLVLMTAMLFIGANAWGATAINVATYDELIAAVEGPATGEEGAYNASTVVEITLIADLSYSLGSVTNYNYSAQNLADAKAHISEIWKGQTVSIDLNGHSITSDALHTFAIYHGKLYFTGQGTVSNTLHRYNSSNSSTKMAEASVVWMVGTNQVKCDPKWSYLSVGADVNLNCNLGKCGVYVYDLYDMKVQDSPEVRLDNGYTANTAKTIKQYATSSSESLNWSTVSDAGKKCAYGVYADIYGTVHGLRYGLQMTGNLNAIPASNIVDPSIPTYYLHAGAVASSSNTVDESAGIYIGGYSRAIIEGTAFGNTGVYVKSGVIVINNATIYSNATGNYVAPQSKSGVDSKGSGVVMDTNSGYAGEINVTVSGDSHISGSTGYAIDEKVTKTATEGQTNVDALTITGGTFDTGENGQGAITISENTVNASNTSDTTNVAIVSGNVAGTITVGDESSEHSVTEVVKPETPGGDVTMTTVIDESGKAVVVISQGAAPEDKTTVNNQTGTVNWKHDDSSTDPMTENITINTTLTALTMNQNYAQTLTVKEGKTLQVDRIILGKNAQIIVEPTAKLIVNGTEGITTTAVTNLVLQANNTTQGALLFNPVANSNRQPHATVQFTTQAYQKDATNYQWQRFTSPLAEITAVGISASSIPGTWGGASFSTVVCQWDYVNDAWSAPMASIQEMKPFVGYTLTNNATAAGVRYNFKGRIQGTVSDDLTFKATGFNYFGNPYTASMHILTLLNNLANAKVDETVYTWRPDKNAYIQANAATIASGVAKIDTIPALQTIILRLKDDATAAEMTAKMNYTKSVWEWGTKTGAFAPSSPAPQRAMSNYSSVCITVAGADGSEDVVTLIANADFSDEYESGADAIKLMNENNINLYAITDEAQAIVATDNLVGTMLSLQTMDEVSYTMSFDKVNGEVYALRDNLTNAVVLMNEGATYNFMAQSNATLDGRFQIVSRQEMPTAVETVEETAAPKAIYTVMGQYVGETTDWNNLPAGVYVVDGVKIVK